MEQLINELLQKVKANKKYKSISNEIVLEEIKNYLKKNTFLKKPDKQSVSEIRKQLHCLYSSYQTKKKKKRYEYLEELKKNLDNPEITKKLLSITISTSERLDNYPAIYQQIFQVTGKPKTIIDLGCGLNPLSFLYMNLNELNYYVYDIDEEDIDFLNEYFDIIKTKGLNGKAEILDSRDLKKISELPRADIIFMFKLIDLIDAKNKKVSEELIKKLFRENKTRFIIASFATKTLTRKPMNLPRRKGFELMLLRIGLKFQTIKTGNEVFYVIYE